MIDDLQAGRKRHCSKRCTASASFAPTSNVAQLANENRPRVPGETHAHGTDHSRIMTQCRLALHAGSATLQTFSWNTGPLDAPLHSPGPEPVAADFRPRRAGYRAADHSGRAQRFYPDRPLRRSHCIVRCVCAALPAGRALHPVRHYARGQADEGPDRLHQWRARPAIGRATQVAGGLGPGRHPCRRDRWQGCGLSRSARVARRQGRQRRARQAGVGVRTGIQRRRT